MKAPSLSFPCKGCSNLRQFTHVPATKSHWLMHRVVWSLTNKRWDCSCVRRWCGSNIFNSDLQSSLLQGLACKDWENFGGTKFVWVSMTSPNKQYIKRPIIWACIF